MGVYTHSDGNWLTRRGTFLILLIAFHVLLFWALKSGFAVKFIESIAPPIVADIINEVKPDEPPPPPPQVKMEIPPVTVPPVVVDITLPVDAPTTALSNVTDRPTPPAPPPPPVARAPVITKAAVTYKPDVFDYYPSTSRNLGEEGKVKIRICTDVKGKVTEATVPETSGFPRLDEAGVRIGKQFRFKPATEDGKPVAQCFVLPVSFNLKGEG
jgi:periplasmic protein TonB